MLETIKKVITLVQHPRAIGALLAWPKFSMASFLIVSRLKQCGIAPKTVIDVGANVGQFAVAAGQVFEEAEVISIEPDPDTARRLRDNVRNLPVRVLDVALGEAPGVARFNVNADRQVSSFLPLGRDRQKEFPKSTVIDSIEVKVETLDSLFSGAQLNYPVLVKLDVQGFEGHVLRGGTALLSKVQWVLVEVAFGELYEGSLDFMSIVRLLEGCGFDFVRPINWHVSSKTGEMIEMDALFERRNRGTATP